MTAAPLQIELVRGLHNVRKPHRGCVLTVGKFDGVHLGHQALLRQTREAADAHGLPATVFSFDPSPQEFFSPDKLVVRISTFRDKLIALQRYGVDCVLMSSFDQAMADTSREDFVEKILVDQLGIKVIVVGDDLRFGHNREGDINYLLSRSQELGYTVTKVNTVEANGIRCSSSAVRAALGQCNFPLAEQMLGRPYAVTGRIRKGLQLGRTLDMPTANISVQKPLAIPLGVYAVLARCAGASWQGVASLGVRPTLGLAQRLLETHLFDADPDLYGQLLEVEFRHHLRPEEKFESLDTLQAQMHKDAAQARRLLNS